MIGMVSNAQNPEMMLNQLMANNPMLKQISEIAAGYNGDYQKAFYGTAKQKGIDPNEILGLFR